MSSVARRAMQDVVAVLEAVVISCGSTDALDEARSTASMLLESLREGWGSLDRVERVMERLVELILEAREELETRGCLDAYRLDDAIAALEYIRGASR